MTFTSNAGHLTKEQSLPVLKRLEFKSESGSRIRTRDASVLPATLPRPVLDNCKYVHTKSVK